MTFDPAFKKALQSLPDSEKDKLILRLLKLNLNLANKLRFELVDTDTVEDKRAQVQDQIAQSIKCATERYYSAGILMMEARGLSGIINEHVSITKDKLGEISLSCFLLRQLLELNNERIAAETPYNTHTLCIYIVAKLFKILLLIEKQHEDLHMEFREDIEAIGKLLGKNDHLMRTAIHHSLDVNWLIRFEIPHNIVEIHKDLRKNGFLK